MKATLKVRVKNRVRVRVRVRVRADDIGNFLFLKATDLEKDTFLQQNGKQRQTSSGHFQIKNQGGKQRKRFLHLNRMDQYPDFAYNEKANGIFCKVCVLAGERSASYCTETKLGKLVVVPLARYGRLTGAAGDLSRHLLFEYHKNA